MKNVATEECEEAEKDVPVFLRLHLYLLRVKRA